MIPNPTGLHARPAAVLANLAKSFQSTIKLQLGDRQANARSVTAIMALDVAHGAKVQVVASGPDATAAVEKLAQVLAAGLRRRGLRTGARAGDHHDLRRRPRRRRAASRPIRICCSASPASPGLAVGEVFQVRRTEIVVTEAGAGVDAERRHLAAAIATAQAQLAALRAQLHAKADPAKAAIFAAHEELLSDPDLLEIAESAIAKGKSAAFAWKKAVTTHADRLAGLRNQLLAQRANDLRDVGLRVLSILTGVDIRQPQYPPNSILIAEDLTPSDTATLDRSRVVGFCTTRGGATSHVAILARSLGIPALAGIEPAALDVPNGTLVILDGNKGTLRLHAVAGRSRAHPPGAGARRTAPRRRTLAHALEPAVTLDGTRIEVLANIGGLKDADADRRTRRRRRGPAALGVPLHGTRRRADRRASSSRATRPSPQALGRERPLIIRTLDVGGDKPLAYLPIPEGGQSVPRRARRAGRPRSPRDPAHAAPRDPARRRVRQGQRHVPDDRDAERAARREGDARRGGRQPRRPAACRPASWWKCLPRP